MWTHLLPRAALAVAGGRVDLDGALAHEELDAFPVVPDTPLPVLCCLSPRDVLKE